MTTITGRHRRLGTTLILGLSLSLAPLSIWDVGAVQAQSPTSAVTGLSRGSQGDAVKSVQRALIDQGLDVSGGADGVFGPGTESALKTFQSQQGLSSTGVVDDATALALGLTSSSLMGLTVGSQGDAVKQLQEKLMNAGVEVTGGADGVFGSGTARAVKSYQSSKGFSPTGVVNASTAAALENVSGSASTAISAAEVDTPAARAGEAEASPTADSSSMVGLKIGSRGPAVERLQRAIISAGFTVVGGADGIFGALTANALKSLQNANGLDSTGVVSEATAKVLISVESNSGAADTAADTDADTGADHAPEATSPFDGLQYGSLGADVKSLQNTLIAAGIHVPGGADGVFGTATRDAVKEFQASQGLEATGKVDEKTANALSSGASASGDSTLVGLTAGALGNTVKKLQQALIDAGVDVRGGADGIFGPATANALKEFQTSQGLDATGKVDQATADALASPKQPVAAAGQGEGGFPEFGEKGERVLALQAALVKAGVEVRGGVDGDFGGGTSAAVMEFQRLNGLSVTGKVSDKTAELLGLQRMAAPAVPDASSVQLAAFPVQGKCYYGDTWAYPRGGGRIHLGVDIIAPEGKLLYAVADGTITKVYADYPGSLAGNGIRLTMADGTYFFYAHMLGVAEGIKVGTKVKAGQIVGAVGDTGSSGTNHLHLEIHPQGGSAINPYPLVKAIDGCDREEPLPQP